MSTVGLAGKVLGNAIGTFGIVHALACPIHGVIPLSLYGLNKQGVFEGTVVGSTLDSLHNGLVEKVAAPITAKFYENPYPQPASSLAIDPNNPFARYVNNHGHHHSESCAHSACNHGARYKPEVYEDAHMGLSIFGNTAFVGYAGFIGHALLIKRRRPKQKCKHKICNH